MPKAYLSPRNLRFLLHEVFHVGDLCQYPYYADHNGETFDMVLDAAKQLADKLLLPLFREMDRQPPEYIDGRITVHPQVRTLMRAYGEGGWIPASFAYAEGGQQLPVTIANLVGFILGAANYSASIFPFLSTGAANLIRTFGAQDLKQTYIPPMMAGEWQGTMALTEPQAGSSLSDVQTSAEPTDGDYYLIKGQKIFISAGDHDGVDNVVHLMLARIKGAPVGVKGISLFVVPKKRPENGQLIGNDVFTAGMYHKMGYKGAPIAHLIMGDQADCRGWLVGEANKGLSYMFQMMNEARLGVGMGAASIASAAYYCALEYATERPQGRPLAAKNPMTPQVAIAQHPDVKRMLLFQKSVVEGSLALLTQCGIYTDHEKMSEGPAKHDYFLLLDLLTPIAKTYPSEMAIQTTSAAIQVLGGYGYTEDFAAEQFFRDTRIHPIHEGTTGIQGLDLLGRKVLMEDGKAFRLFINEVNQTIAQAIAVPSLEAQADKLAVHLDQLAAITDYLATLAKTVPAEVFLADATLYLEYFGIVAIAWQWLKQGLVAQQALHAEIGEDDRHFYQGKLHTLRYFMEYELPKTLGLHARLLSLDRVTVETQASYLG